MRWAARCRRWPPTVLSSWPSANPSKPPVGLSRRPSGTWPVSSRARLPQSTCNCLKTVRTRPCASSIWSPRSRTWWPPTAVKKPSNCWPARSTPNLISSTSRSCLTLQWMLPWAMPVRTLPNSSSCFGASSSPTPLRSCVLNCKSVWLLATWPAPVPPASNCLCMNPKTSACSSNWR
ncbi:hypothetical protein D3C80_1561310 [compost metagenome]